MASATIQEVDSRPDVTERSISSVSMLPRPGNIVLKMIYPDSARIRRPPLPNGAIRILPNG